MPKYLCPAFVFVCCFGWCESFFGSVRLRFSALVCSAPTALCLCRGWSADPAFVCRHWESDCISGLRVSAVELAVFAAEPVDVAVESADVEAEFADAEVEPADAAAEPVDVAVEPVDVAVEPVDVAVEPADVEAELVHEAVERELIVCALALRAHVSKNQIPMYRDEGEKCVLSLFRSCSFWARVFAVKIQWQGPFSNGEGGGASVPRFDNGSADFFPWRRGLSAPDHAELRD